MNITNKFCLKWDEFSENITSTLNNESELEDFTDITLVCEDGAQIEAHRLVLSGGSNFFSAMLRLKKGSSSIMYMRGLKSKDLTAIVDFLYHGEVNIDQDDLNEFLEIAEEFQLKGLVGAKENVGKQPPMADIQTMTKYPDKIKPKKQQNITENHESYITNTSLIKPEFDQNACVSVKPADLVNVNDTENWEQKMKDMLDTTGEHWKCTACGKEAPATKDGRKNLKRHTQTHMEGLSYTCMLCGKGYRYKHTLKTHMDLSHNHLQVPISS